MAPRGAIRARRGTNPSTERDAGSHSVERIIGLFLLIRKMGSSKGYAWRIF
jgi:hypothetical protein